MKNKIILSTSFISTGRLLYNIITSFLLFLPFTNLNLDKINLIADGMSTPLAIAFTEKYKKIVHKLVLDKIENVINSKPNYKPLIRNLNSMFENKLNYLYIQNYPYLFHQVILSLYFQ